MRSLKILNFVQKNVWRLSTSIRVVQHLSCWTNNNNHLSCWTNNNNNNNNRIIMIILIAFIYTFKAIRLKMVKWLKICKVITFPQFGKNVKDLSCSFTKFFKNEFFLNYFFLFISHRNWTKTCAVRSHNWSAYDLRAASLSTKGVWSWNPTRDCWPGAGTTWPPKLTSWRESSTDWSSRSRRNQGKIIDFLLQILTVQHNLYKTFESKRACIFEYIFQSIKILQFC